MKLLNNILSALARGVNDLSPRCKDVARLQSDALDRPLPFRKRLGLSLHLLICRWCRRYGRHIAFLREAGQHCSEHDHLPSATLSADARERIRQALKEGQDPK